MDNAKALKGADEDAMYLEASIPVLALRGCKSVNDCPESRSRSCRREGVMGLQCSRELRPEALTERKRWIADIKDRIHSCCSTSSEVALVLSAGNLKRWQVWKAIPPRLCVAPRIKKRAGCGCAVTQQGPGGARDG